MSDDMLDRMCDMVQTDVGQRGLRADPARNLVTETTGDFRAACASLAGASSPGLVIVTGFLIPTADPPAGETDGPLGAVFLARALVPLGFRVGIAADPFCIPALNAGLSTCGFDGQVKVISLPSPAMARKMTPDEYCHRFLEATGDLKMTHLLAIERVGPSHGRAQVPPQHRDRCHTMRGRDITDAMSPAHWLFEAELGARTIGIGDGGNEIGMGKVPWEVIDANIPQGGLVACRVATNYLIVAGVSNWGGYALAAGVYALRRVRPDPRLFDADEERRILTVMVEQGQLVDGVLARPSVTVDGLTWEQYNAVLPRLGGLALL